MKKQKQVEIVLFQARANMRELYIHEINNNIEQEDIDVMKSMCKIKGIKTNL